MSALLEEQSFDQITVRPSLYVFHKVFIIAVHLDDKTLQKKLRKRLESKHASDPTTILDTLWKKAKVGETVSIEINCSTPGFKFNPEGACKCTIDDNIRRGKIFYKQLVISGFPQEEQDIGLEFICHGSGSVFCQYRWIPGSRRCRVSGTITCEGGTVEATGCSVEFKPGTFEAEREITVTAEVDSSKCPESDGVISPILDVDVGKIKKPAKVRLPTWIEPNDDYVVEVMHYSKELEQWEKIAKCTLKDGNFVEFECEDFSWLYARLVKLFWGKARFYVVPSLHIYDKHFIVAVHLDNQCIEWSFKESLEEGFHKKSTISKTAMSESVGKGETFKIGVEFMSPTSEFEFKEKGIHECVIGGDILKGKIFHKQFIIHSQSKEAREIPMRFIIGSDDPDTFIYQWRLDEGKSRAASMLSETDEHAFSSTTPIIIHNTVTVTDDQSKSESIGTKNVGGTVNQTYTNSTANIIGSSKSQQPKASDGNVKKLKVSVKYSDYLAGIFEGFYKPDQTLHDVIKDMCRKENGEKVEYHILNGGIKMDKDTQISSLHDEGILNSMTAVKLRKPTDNGVQ